MRHSRAVCAALRLAHEASVRLGHDAVGSGHLLLGLLEEAHGVAYAALGRLGVGRIGANLSRVAEKVMREMGRTTGDPGAG